MARGYLGILLLLAAVWGASFMFIKVAVEELAPSTLMLARVASAAIPFLLVMAWQVGWRRVYTDLRSLSRQGIVLGAINMAVPFVLIGWGEIHVDSGVAAIANSSMPIFVAALAVKLKPEERVRGLRLIGLFLGLAGVAVLAGARPDDGWWAVAGTLACVAAALCYAVGSLYTQSRVTETSVLLVSTTTTFWATVLLLPLGIAQAPGELPSWEAIGSVAALGLLGTFLGSILYFQLIDKHGASRASLVVYLLPVTALFWGALLLDESLSLPKLVGLALILAGVAFGSGLLRLSRREQVAPSPAP